MARGSARLTPVRMLLVEDNPDDLDITRRALERARVAVKLEVARDGQEALDYLFGRSENGGRRPDLVLLDLNLPRVHGSEVLRRIKNDPGLRTLPVIVLSVSERQEDIRQCYDLGGNSYIAKPVDFDGFLAAMQTLEEYWLAVAELPPRD